MGYIYSEIKSQYQAAAKTLEQVIGQQEEIKAVFQKAQAKKLLFLGCGSSYEISVSGQYNANLSGLPAFALAAGDMMLHPEDYRNVIEDSLVIIVTRSGETHEILKAVELLKEKFGRMVLSVIARENSALERLSDCTVLIPWAFDESVCQTRTVSNLYLCAILLNAIFTGNQKAVEQVKTLTVHGGQYLERVEPELHEVARGSWKQAYVLGDGELCGILREGALAFSEIARISGKYYHVLDVRHGPMVLVDGQTLVIVVLRREGYDFYKKLVEDLVRKNAQVVTFTFEDCPAIEGTKLAVSYHEKTGYAQAGVPTLNLIQLIAYYKAIETGFDPDYPEGLDAYIKLG